MKVIIGQLEFEVESDEAFWKIIDKWEKHSFEIFNYFLNKDNNLIDVGAWNGVLSMYGSRLCNFVYSFEPDSVAFRNITRNIELNNIENIKLENKGCYTENGKQILYYKRQGDSVSSLLNRTAENYVCKTFIEIQTIKLSEYLKDIDNIGLIKIDIEGGEIYVIEEMKDYIKEFSPNIYISFHPFWFPDKDKNISDMMEILSNYKHIYNILLKEISKEEAIKGLYNFGYGLIFSNIKI